MGIVQLVNQALALSADDVRRAGRQLEAPFSLRLGLLALPQHIEVLTIHRLLPGKRLTAQARWCGRVVLLKLFLDRRAYQRHWQREGQGLLALSDAGITTPRVLAQADSRKHRCAVILSDYLTDARSLASLAADAQVAAATLQTLAAMHHAGLQQTDCHPDNFLWSDGRVYAIDGAGVYAGTAPLPAPAALHNLALWLAQFAPAQTESVWLPQIAQYYAADLDFTALNTAIDQQRQQRWHDYRRKLQRNCTEIRCERHWRSWLAVRREADSAELRALLAAPDLFIEHGECLKDGNSATVTRVRLSDRSVVIKRYNLKHWRHVLSRCWRPSRAWQTWLNGHYLCWLGIATAQPLAVLERRHGPLRGVAYVVMEDIVGPTLAKLEPRQLNSTRQAVANLLTALFRAGLLHGDLKASNVVLAETGPHLLDLDALHQPAHPQQLKRGYARERARFLDNWPLNSSVRRWFDEHLPTAN